jgi:diguanylate cyclase (GGDEF)-like protein
MKVYYVKVGMKILKLLFKLFISTIIISELYAKDKDLENISIQLKWFSQYQFAGIYVAKEKGFYKDAGLNVTIKERDPKKNNILQVVSGESEYGVADSVILRYRAEGHPVKVLAAIFQHNAMVLMSKKESGIVSPYEMKGKKISYQKGLDDSIISSLLSFANIAEGEYIKTPMDFTHMDFINGEVDISEAYISIEPYWIKQKYNIDVNIIDPKNYGIDFYGDLIFTTQKEIDEHPKRVEAFKKATLKGWAYALNHKDESIRIILDKYNTRDLKYEQLLYEARVTENLIATKYVPLGNLKEERFQILGNLYAGKGLSDKALQNAVKNIIYNPNAKQNWFLVYLHEIIVAVVLLFLLVLLLLFNNRRLKYLVDEKTKNLKRRSEKIRQQHQLLNDILNTTDNIMIITDFNNIKFSNNKFKELVNVGSPDLLNKFISTDGYLHQGLLKENEDFVSLVSRTAPKNRIISILDANSRPKAFKISISKTTNDGDYLVSLSDITEIKEQHVETTKKAYIDGLTKVYNRNKFDELFLEELKTAQRYKNSFSVVLLDIDKFKDVNDNYGHLIGDEILITMAQVLNKNIRETDVFARWGGEEFVILFRQTSIKEAKDISLKLKSFIQKNKHPTAGTISASFGVTEYIDGDSTESIFKRCDNALYMAKRNGRNRVEVL